MSSPLPFLLQPLSWAVTREKERERERERLYLMYFFIVWYSNFYSSNGSEYLLHQWTNILQLGHPVAYCVQYTTIRGLKCHLASALIRFWSTQINGNQSTPEASGGSRGYDLTLIGLKGCSSCYESIHALAHTHTHLHTHTRMHTHTCLITTKERQESIDDNCQQPLRNTTGFVNNTKSA